MHQISDHQSNLINHFAQGNDNLVIIAGKLPLSEVKEFRTEGNRFEIIFNRQVSGSLSHSDTKWEKAFANSTVTIEKKVSGRIDAQNRTLSIDSGIYATKGTGWLSFSVYLSTVQCSQENENFIVAGKKFGVSMPTSLSIQDIVGTNIEWEK